MTMKSFTLELLSRDLKSCMDTAMQAADRSTKTPILQAVRISIVDSTASFAITNTDHSVIARSPAAGDGTVFLSFEMLAQKAAALRQDQPVTLAEDAGSVIIRQGKTRWKVPLIDGAGWPDAYFEAVSGEAVTIKTSSLLAALNLAAEHINPQDTRVIGRGPYLDMTDGFVVIGSATKGIRVMRVDAPVLANSFVLPLESVRAVGTIFRDATEVSINTNARAISVEADGTVYRSKLIEDKYVDWRNIVKLQTAKLDGSFVVNTAEFLAATERATAIGQDITKSSKSVGARYALADGEMTIHCRNGSGEEGDDTCSVDGVNGTFGVAAQYIFDAVASIGAERIRMSINTSEDGPIMIVAEPSPELDDYRIVMGMRVAP